MDAKQNASVPWVHYWGDRALPASPFQVDDACLAALETLHPNGDRSTALEHFGGSPLACDPDNHPDAHAIRAWLAIGHRAATDLHVIFWLAYFVRNEWARLPQRTHAEHHALYQRIATLCRELRSAMHETGTGYLDGTGRGMRNVAIFTLLNDFELASLVSGCVLASEEGVSVKRVDNPDRRLLNILLLPPAGIPDVATLLGRLEGVAKLLDVGGPLHTQPKKHGAERGYFVRRIAALFQKRYGAQPHEVIAALATIALGEPTDRELVAKLLTPRTL